MALPDSPLVLSVSLNGRQVSLKNVAHKRVVSYRLGQVGKKNGLPKVIHLTSPLEVDLASGEKLINPHEVREELRRSHKGRAKLKVMEVTFENGLVWRRNL